ncbi:uncharacterized protein [Amphiura filiformis]|uniref:uncharacterized protein n=1 Tax=Amphiura filiformis TaxID=82378 RepID=UPI003B218FBE
MASDMAALDSNFCKEQLDSLLSDFDLGNDIASFFDDLPLTCTDDVTELVVTCKGNINDVDLQQKLRSMQHGLSLLAKADQKDVVISKVEPWNSIRVTFNIPPDAAIRLRQLAQNGDHALQQLGILSVQIEQGDVIQVPVTAAGGQAHQQAQPQVATPAARSEATQPMVAASSASPAMPGAGAARFPSEFLAMQQNRMGSAAPSVPPQSSIAPPMQSLQNMQSQMRPMMVPNQIQQTPGLPSPQFGGQVLQQQQQPPNPAVSAIPWGGMQEQQQRQHQMRQNIWGQMPIPNLVPFNMPNVRQPAPPRHRNLKEEACT